MFLIARRCVAYPSFLHPFFSSWVSERVSEKEVSVGKGNLERRSGPGRSRPIISELGRQHGCYFKGAATAPNYRSRDSRQGEYLDVSAHIVAADRDENRVMQPIRYGNS